MAKIAGRRFGHIRRLRLAEDKLSHARLNSSPKTATMSNAFDTSAHCGSVSTQRRVDRITVRRMNLPILSLNPVPLQGACVSRESIRGSQKPPTIPSARGRILLLGCRRKSPGRCISLDRNPCLACSGRRREDRDARSRQQNKWKAART